MKKSLNLDIQNLHNILGITRTKLVLWIGFTILLAVLLIPISLVLEALTIVKQMRVKILKTFGKK